ncbi:MAG: CBS domain-containing protein [Candidatus Binatia bacterium]
MEKTIVSCRPDDDVKHVMSIMTQKRARHIPVMVNHRLVGLVSVGDVVKFRLDNCELEVNVLRDRALVHSLA